MMGVIGNDGDAMHFTDFISTHISLYEIKNGYPMETQTVVHFTRHHLLANVASKVKYMVAMLLACFDPKRGPNLCFIDAHGASQSLNYSGHGIGHTICMSIFHMLWKPGLTIEGGQSIIRKCVAEIQNRLIVNLRHFEVYLVDKDGIRKLDSVGGKQVDLINQECIVPITRA
ncbi:probable proteasome subunit beta type-2 isoform X2 [Drosophila hydei]|nr:probable proteasome subunit beta type-2 isoform X2 [Drosophila hydei]